MVPALVRPLLGGRPAEMLPFVPHGRWETAAHIPALPRAAPCPTAPLGAHPDGPRLSPPTSAHRLLPGAHSTHYSP